MDQRPRCALRTASGLDAIGFKRFDDAVGVEILHAHAEMVDAAGTRRGIGAATATAEHEELDPVPDA